LTLCNPIILFTVFSVSMFILSCKQIPQSTDTKVDDKEKQENRFDDLTGALNYEFNMLKNPVTGKIPEGIRENELQQAQEIYKKQSIVAPTAFQPTLLNTYIFEGPDNLGGRTRALVYDIRFNGTTNQIILAGGVSGGVYKSIDNGATWIRKSPTGQLFSITSIVQDPRVGNQNTWYYSTGESLGNSTAATGAFYFGNGIYKSTDNGETWTRLANSNLGALESFDARQDLITKLAVDPTNGNVYMAAIDAIYRSTNGGTTWANILTSGSGTIGSVMVTDIAITSTGRLYAAFAGGSNTGPTLDMPGVWTSITGDASSWTKIAGDGSATNPAGWNADGAYGRVVLAIAPSNENLVYTLYWNNVSNTTCTPAGNPEAELFLWNQATTTWTERTANLPNETGCLRGNDPFAVQEGYDLIMAVKPNDANTLFIGGTNIYRSTDGFSSTVNTTRIGGYASAASYALYANSHPDIHALVFQPGTTTTMLCGNDGGIQRTTNNLAATVAWTRINTGYRTYQYYYVALDPRTGNNKVIGGAQDNGTTRNIGGTGTNFEQVYSGDGVSVGLSDVIAGNTFEYCGSQLGDIERRNSTSGLGSVTDITPTTASTTGLFVTLFQLDPDNTQNLYYADNNSLYRTSTASTTTTTLGAGSWSNMTGTATAVGAANDITAFATTRGTYNVLTASLFMGTSNAKIFRLDNPANAAAAASPVNISGAGFPAGGYISSIAVNPRNDDTVLVTFSNYGVTSVFWTKNANAATPTWLNVEGNLTLPSLRSSAILIKNNVVEYYVGTSVGLYDATIDGTSTITAGNTSWAQEGPTDIGNAVVTSIAVRPSDNKLLIGTHGYGMWSSVIGGALPITLLDFSGKLQENDVALSWSTSLEYNSKTFEIEKSIDGISYKSIASLPAARNSSSIRTYNYTDREAGEINYYRLKMIDIDGSSKHSNVVLVKNSVVVQRIVAVNNPFTDNISIRFAKVPKGRVALSLTDISGKIIGTTDFNRPTSSILRLNIYNKVLSSGVYILHAEAEGKSYSLKLVRQ
jgi:hypothetical protein